jgi:hypothetical protein
MPEIITMHRDESGSFIADDPSINRASTSSETQSDHLSPRDKELMDIQGTKIFDMITEVEKDKDLKFLDMVTVKRTSGDIEDDWYIASPTIDLDGNDRERVVVRKNDDSQIEKTVDVETLRGWQVAPNEDEEDEVSFERRNDTAAALPVLPDLSYEPYVGRHRGSEKIVSTVEEDPTHLLNRLSQEYEEKVAVLDAEQRQAQGIDDDEVDLTTLYNKEHDATRRREIVIPRPGRILGSVINSVRERFASLSLDKLAHATGMGVAHVMNATERAAARFQMEAQQADGSTERRWNKKRLMTAGVVGGVAIAAAFIAHKNGLHFGGNSGSSMDAVNGANDTSGQLPPIDGEPTPAVGSGVDHIVSAHSPLNEAGAASPAEVMPAGFEQSAPIEVIDYKQFNISNSMGGESFAHQLGQDKDFWYANEKAFHKAFPNLTYKMSDGHFGFSKAGELSEKAAKWWTARLSK